jgi:hypothetical protein
MVRPDPDLAGLQVNAYLEDIDPDRVHIHDLIIFKEGEL